MTTTDVLLLGGGLAGLACRAGLRDERECLLVEAQSRVGGLARVHVAGPYVFDTVVHVLTFRRRQLRDALQTLLPAGFREFPKRTLVWQGGHVLPYPYQFNTGVLPDAIRQECIDGFLARPRETPALRCLTFEDWLRHQFGDGLYRHFFLPYNTKLYGLTPDALEAAPLAWSIPSGNEQAVLKGSTAHDESTAPLVEYPAGPQGIEALSRSLEQLGVDPVVCGDPIVHIDPVRHLAIGRSGTRYAYQELVSSLPLPVVLSLVTDLPGDVADSAAELSARSVRIVSVGSTANSSGLPALWTYFPDPDVPFYRLTRLEQISPDLCPAGAAALLMEIGGTYEPDEAALLRTLVDLGVLSSPSADVYLTWTIPYAYVHFRRGFDTAVSRVRSWLSSVGIRTVGRYGAWMYANIEQTIDSGLATARQLLARGRAGEVLRWLGA